jgi:hypothetical protein
MAGAYFTKDNLYGITDKGGKNFYIEKYDSTYMGHELTRAWFNYTLPGILTPYCKTTINNNITIL